MIAVNSLSICFIHIANRVKVQHSEAGHSCRGTEAVFVFKPSLAACAWAHAKHSPLAQTPHILNSSLRSLRSGQMEGNTTVPYRSSCSCAAAGILCGFMSVRCGGCAALSKGVSNSGLDLHNSDMALIG